MQISQMMKMWFDVYFLLYHDIHQGIHAHLFEIYRHMDRILTVEDQHLQDFCIECRTNHLHSDLVLLQASSFACFAQPLQILMQ